MDQRNNRTKDHPLTGEVEQLEPEHVMWLFEKGYACKDKQATRLTEEGRKWLEELTKATNALLERLRGGKSNV